jgi:murein L,D-transpeptidase YafK
MAGIRLILILVVVVGLTACSKFKTYNGPEVTRVVVFKEARQMQLLHYDQVLAVYEIDLGFAPVGDKQIEGDGKTPEGDYFIDRRNPNSAFHLSLGISYPNEQDIAEAKALGKSPGGDIFIHGRPSRFSNAGDDWTWG